MSILEDGFFVQLVVIPILVIGLGVGSVFIFRKKFFAAPLFAPIVTLVLNKICDFYFFKNLGFSIWDIVFPVISLFLAFPFFYDKSKKYSDIDETKN